MVTVSKELGLFFDLDLNSRKSRFGIVLILLLLIVGRLTVSKEIGLFFDLDLNSRKSKFGILLILLLLVGILTISGLKSRPFSFVVFVGFFALSFSFLISCNFLLYLNNSLSFFFYVHEFVL